MKKMYYSLLLSIILLFNFTGTLESATVIVQRERTYLREGPGSYYKIITEIPVKTKLTVRDSEDYWLKVVYQKKEGYISKTAIQIKEQRNDVFAKMGKSPSNITVSQHGMSAGVKGFGERFAKAFKGDVNFLTAAEVYQLDAKEYQRFKKDTYKNIDLKKLRKANRLPIRKIPDYFTEAQEGFGLGVASAIASLGLYQDPVLQEYVNSVGQLIVEGSDATDVTFKFFILNIDKPNAYACPGGYIFVTKGMLKYINSEAELACILAHEVAHVSRFHGIQEIQLRKNQIGADEAFADLDEELPDAYDEETKLTEEELEQEAFSMYETIIQGRLDGYELEADLYGMLYAVRAGYNPNALKNIVLRMINDNVSSNNEHFRPSILSSRFKWIKKNCDESKYPDYLLVNKERWNKYSVSLK